MNLFAQFGALIAAFFLPASLWSSPIPVIQRQGTLHGFLLLVDDKGNEIAAGDQINTLKGDLIESRLLFRFNDGSIDDETAIYKQGSVFELIRDHHIQKGPSFPTPADITIDVPSGQVTWIDDSKRKTQHMTLPNDLVNGLIGLTVQNFPAKSSEMQASYLAISSKPRVVNILIKPDGSDHAQLGKSNRKLDRYNLHFDLGGVVGFIASVIGKQPPDLKLWVTDGPTPVFVKLHGPLYLGGPYWTMQLAAPR